MLGSMNTQVLVVDDSESFRRTLRELLGARGFRVLADAVDGPSALAAVAQQRPDGVLLDINLPGADGLAVAESLTSRYPGLRIVLTSSDVDDVPAEQLDACGARAFIPKTQLVAADLQRGLG
jgi:CheY-like chemotaxis protein